jgi:phospholipid/cholesterol/gamma-HCH transport system permease protein
MPQETPPTIDPRPARSGVVTVVVAGDWSLHRPHPEAPEIAELSDTSSVLKTVALDTSNLGNYDSCLIALLVELARRCADREVSLDSSACPEGVRELLKLALTVPETITRTERPPETFFARVGKIGLGLSAGVFDVFAFLGETSLSLGRLVRGQALFRWQDVWLIIQRTGAEALPIVTLINLLVGMIIAFVGVVQLHQFGASVYVANLVGLGMVRELGCLMTGIIMSGRTGAAFAAEIGSMKVNQEIDALKTLGFSPMDFLVLPRVIALVLMLPLLTAYGNVMGMIGGGLVAPAFDVSIRQYVDHVIAAVTLPNYFAGIVKSLFFGAIIAGAGCLKGLQSGNSSAAVGLATTSAVVVSITTIVALDAVFAVLFAALGL